MLDLIDNIAPIEFGDVTPDALVRSFLYNARRAESGLYVADVIGWGWADVIDEWSGRLRTRTPFVNLVTQTGDQYYGDRASWPGVTRAVGTMTAATNANPSSVTMAGHGMAAGDPVKIGSVTPVVGATGLNGSWVVTAVTSSSVFTVTIGAAPGVWSSGGDIIAPAEAYQSGMRLGTGSTATAKTGAGSFITTYTSGSFKALDATYPQSSLNGASRQEQYKTTWPAGTVTQNGLNEVALTNEQPISDVAGVAANTISRALLSPVVNKGAGDSLAITWNHLLLGA
jgi:hypothetical protein